jgi:glycosyltransferase involved in cell wall biosynthesis
MQIIAIASGSYPFGGAATNRHLSCLSGLHQLRAEVDLLIVQPARDQSEKSQLREGLFNGIRFRYLRWFKPAERSLLQKIQLRFNAHRDAMAFIREQRAKNPGDIRLIVYVTAVPDILPYLWAALRYRIPVYHERTEYPFLGISGMLNRAMLSLYLKHIIPRFDGIFVISKALQLYFKEFIAEQKILHLPMTVEFERFNPAEAEASPFTSRYIAYCGSMYTDKDGVPDLIRAFGIFCRSNKEVNLVLIGDHSDRRKFTPIRECIDASPFPHRIICTGWVDRDEMPRYLRNAAVLALARPDNIQARGGFPTKLGEYLATGVPVVITDVGEHSSYLTHEQSAYLSPAGEPELFAANLLKAITHPEEAAQIGARGREVALHSFNYQIQAQRLLEFMTHPQHA